MKMIPLGKSFDSKKFLVISAIFLITCSLTLSDTSSSCTSADEFAAPADGHCLPLRSCTAIHSGSNTPKFRLILKALLCEQNDSSVENPKICCPDVKTNLIGIPTDAAQPSQLFPFSIEDVMISKEKEYTTENDSKDVNVEESSEFDYKDNNSSALKVPDVTTLVMTSTTMVTKVDSPEEIAAGPSTTEPGEDADVESRGESQEDQVTTTTEVNENETEKDLDWEGSGEITSGTNAVTDTTDYDHRGKMVAMLENTSGQVEYEAGFGPTPL